MYKLKNTNNQNENLKNEITNYEYSNLWFYNRWKYEKINLTVSDYDYINGGKELLPTNYKNLNPGVKPVPVHSLPSTSNVTINNYNEDYYQQNNSNSLLGTIAEVVLFDDLLNQPPSVINEINEYQNDATGIQQNDLQQPDQFQGFGGGDFGGGGSSGSWDDDSSTQNSSSDTGNNDNSSNYDNSSNDSYSNDSSSSYDSSSSDSSSYDSSSSNDY